MSLIEPADSCLKHIEDISMRISILCEKNDVSLEEIEDINRLLSDRKKYLMQLNDTRDITVEDKKSFICKLKILDERNISMLIEKQERLKAEILTNKNINIAVSLYESNVLK